MSKIKKLNLSQLGKSELEKKEMNSLVGGAGYCCICGCISNAVMTNSKANVSNNQWTVSGGYASGSF